MNETLDNGQSNTSGFAIPYYEIPYEKFFQFGMSVDCVVFGFHEERLKVLLIKRGAPPYKGQWALPGDLVYPNENLDVAAKRVLKDLTDIENLFLQQTKTYGRADRHPAGRVITTGYFSLIDIAQYDPHASAWAEGVYWVNMDEIPDLAFDHNQIAQDALNLLREKARRQLLGLELMPDKFTLGEFQEVCQGLLGTKFDKANFRKRILSTGVLLELNEMKRGVSHRPAKLYGINEKRYNELQVKGILFG